MFSIQKPLSEIKFFLKPSYFKRRKRKIIFVLSTGRCGSTSIVEIANQNSKIKAFHETIPELITLSTKLAEYPESKKEIYKSLKKIFKKRKWEGEKDEIILHSDHRLWNLVDFLADFFPNAIFIHLIRNPVDSAESFYNRKWYQDEEFNITGRKIFAENRLHGDKIKSLPVVLWKEMSAMEKVVWYWNYVNFIINYQLNLVENPHFLFRLENLHSEMNTNFKTICGVENEFHFQNLIINQNPKLEAGENISKQKSLYEAIKKFGNMSTYMFYSEVLLSVNKTRDYD